MIAGEKDLVDDVWRYAVLHGAVASPYDSLNALRGLRTLPIRIARQSSTALALAEALCRHDTVRAVNYAGLASHPQAEIVARQMSAGGSLLSFDVGSAAAAQRFMESVRLTRLATSLGGPETLVTAPSLTTHAALGPDEQLEAGITPGLIRVSVGLEHPDDVLADFVQALAHDAVEGRHEP